MKIQTYIYIYGQHNILLLQYIILLKYFCLALNYKININKAKNIAFFILSQIVNT